MTDKEAKIKKKGHKVKSVRAASDNIKSDVQGSYTGVPEDPEESPVQDADDL